MAIAVSEGSSPVEVPPAQLVAELFVFRYYAFLHTEPQLLHKFYNDGSTVDWQLTSVATLQGINNMIMSSDYKGCSADIIDVRAQDLMEGVLVAVKGFFEKDRVRMSFYQSFFLAPQKNGYFVLNDILFVDGNSNKNVTSTPLSCDPEPADVPTQSEPAETSTCTQAIVNAKTVSNITDTAAEITKKSIDNAETVSNVNDPAAEVNKQSIANAQIVPNVTDTAAEITKKSIDNAETVSNVNDPAAEVTKQSIANAQIVSNVTDTAAEVSKRSIENAETVSNVSDTAAEVPKQSNMPSQNVKHEWLKISYASVVAKECKRASPADNSGYRMVRVDPTANQQSSASSLSKSVTQEQPSSIRSSTENKNSTKNDGVCGEAIISKSIHIRNLPTDVTKNELADAVKKFGQIRQGGIQLRIYEDGFCYGFVDFDSPGSAKSAVEAQSITLRGHVARISYKKSVNRGGNGIRASGGYRAGNFKGQENGECEEDENKAVDVGRARGFNRQNCESVSRNSQSSRDGRAHSQGRNERENSEDADQRDNRRNKRADSESGSKK